MHGGKKKTARKRKDLGKKATARDRTHERETNKNVTEGVKAVRIFGSSQYSADGHTSRKRDGDKGPSGGHLDR